MSCIYSQRFFVFFFFFNDTATTEIYTSIDTLSLHDALPISLADVLAEVTRLRAHNQALADRNARSEEHTSELQSPIDISYAVFCLKKKKSATHTNTNTTTHHSTTT